MGKLIQLSTLQKRGNPGKDLTDFLKRATVLKRHLKEIKDDIAIINFDELRRFFEAKLSCLIIDAGKLEVDFFLCGNYVAALLTEIGNIKPDSWYAVDYFKEGENNPAALKQGANICFLLCSIFPERGNFRCMKTADYEAMGRAMYFNYYNQTRAVIAYLMSQKFKPMAEITGQCFKELRR